MHTYIVDSFTKAAFKGNPAGVCFTDKVLSDDLMLSIAKEFGLSETAFIQPSQQSGVYFIRYFSPKKEIPLCGHATLASAKVVFKTTGTRQVKFINVENLELPVEEIDGEIAMQFPVYDTQNVDVPAAVLNALGIKAIVNSAYSPKNKIILLQIDDAAALAALAPDFIDLINSYTGINGVLVTAKSQKEDFDYEYRYFWPWAGTNEDPVTGGVQTFLAKYWSLQLGKTTMKAFQSSERTGYMNVELKDNKVFIRSEAVILFEGKLNIEN